MPSTKVGKSVLSDAANERRRFGEAYKPLLARVAGKAILGEGNQVGDNTLTLNWRKSAVDPDAGKPSEKARPNTRPRGRKAGLAKPV